MSNPNIKPRLKKGDPETIAIARKGGEAKKGHVSIKSAMKRALDEGRIDVNELVESFYLHAKDGNPAFAKLLLEYVDGRVKEEVDMNVKTKDAHPVAEELKALREHLAKKK